MCALFETVCNKQYLYSSNSAATFKTMSVDKNNFCAKTSPKIGKKYRKKKLATDERNCY